MLTAKKRHVTCDLDGMGNSDCCTAQTCRWEVLNLANYRPHPLIIQAVASDGTAVPQVAGHRLFWGLGLGWGVGGLQSLEIRSEYHKNTARGNTVNSLELLAPDSLVGPPPQIMTWNALKNIDVAPGGILFIFYFFRIISSQRIKHGSSRVRSVHSGRDVAVVVVVVSQ